jgi:hypothetical protein
MLSAKKMARLILGERQECLALSLCCVEISTVAGQPGCYMLYAEPCFKYTYHFFADARCLGME